MSSIKTATMGLLAALCCGGSASAAILQEDAPKEQPAATSKETLPEAPKGQAPEAARGQTATRAAPRPDASKADALPDELMKPEWTKTAELAIPIKLSGYFWTDTGYLLRKNAQSGQPDQNSAYMTGRFVLGAAYARQFGGLSAMAKVELLGLVNEFTKSAYEPHTLDAYVKVGTKSWDVQIGRFLAWEVYYRGQGIELYTAEEAGALGAPNLYLLDYTRGLLNEPGQAAVHWFPTNWLSFELAGVYGQSSQDNFFGGRPVVDVKLGGFELIAGAELLRQAPQTAADKLKVTSKGFAGRLQYSIPHLIVGVDAAQTAVDTTGTDGLLDTSKTYDKRSLGAFIDLDFWKNSIGLGYHQTSQVNRRGEHTTNNQAFASYMYRTPIDGLSVKGVYGFARAHLEDVDANSQWENYLSSFRIRLLYEFH